MIRNNPNEPPKMPDISNAEYRERREDEKWADAQGTPGEYQWYTDEQWVDAKRNEIIDYLDMSAEQRRAQNEINKRGVAEAREVLEDRRRKKLSE